MRAPQSANPVDIATSLTAGVAQKPIFDIGNVQIIRPAISVRLAAAPAAAQIGLRIDNGKLRRSSPSWAMISKAYNCT